jgi:hypothetical protein
MFIKYKSLTTDKISIINVNVNSCREIITSDNKLIIKTENVRDGVIFTLKSKEYAEMALERMFDNMYNSSPTNNLFDLTNLDESINNDSVIQTDDNNGDFGEITGTEDFTNDNAGQAKEFE